MCGPYVHGRSWRVGMRDITDAEVLVLQEMGVLEAADNYNTKHPLTYKGVPINFKDQYISIPRAHGKSAAVNWWKQTQKQKIDSKYLKSLHDMFDKCVVQTKPSKSDIMDAFLYSKPKYLAIDPAMPGYGKKVEAPKEIAMEFDGKRQVPTFKHFCKRMECNTHHEMPTIPHTGDHQSELYDWGIQPWDGKVVNQRSSMSPRLKGEIGKQGYMMNTRKDLRAWCNKHWGTHEDGGEWSSMAYRFFDIKKFLSFLPLKYKQSLDDYDLEDMAGRLAHKLLVKSDCPVEVFADMLDDAPNDYWKGK